MNSVQAVQRSDGVGVFFVGAVVFAFGAAALASCAPIAFSMATVYLFAGPHNWIEFRYFLSRLPARFGGLKRFFAWAFTGVATLTLTNIALVCAVHTKVLSEEAGSILFGCWNTALILWTLRLTFLAAARKDGRDWGLALPVGLALIAFNWFNPSLFGLALVYAHPFVGMWILDREIVRSRPAWRGAYHACLFAIPVFLLLIWCQLGHSPSIADSSDGLVWRITHQAGAGLLPISSRLLVATHTFLETVHYGVWLIVIPIVSAGWRSFQPRSIPISWRSLGWQKLVPAALLLSTFAVAVLWFAFAVNFGVARDIYFTLAIAHVLAEIPFLLKGLM